MSTEKSMDELVKLAAAGNDAAVTELYERTSNHAYYLALQLVKDEDEAQDILEDAYIKALMNIGSLQDPSKFQGWLNSIVVNASKDYLKKKKPVLFSQLSNGNEDDEAVDFVDESEQFSPDATVDYNETKRLVKEMIDNLPEEQRIAIILHYMEDYSVKDIAQVMGCSEGTVKSRLNYGRKQIEKDVLDLEKKGTKLYCAPLVPFLFWMFHTPAATSVISTAAPASMAAGAATDSTVGATVTAGTAAGSTVGATVTTGTAAGSTVGATVSTETAASTVGATVTAGTAAGSTVGATVTTATAAGAAAGSAASGTAAATGLSLAAKIGIVAAVICIGGGAAVGITMMNRNAIQDEDIVAEVKTYAIENKSPVIDMIDESIEEEDEFIPEITQEESEALKRLYQAMETADFNVAANQLYSDYSTIYAIERKYMPDEIIIFDGDKICRKLDGHRMVIQNYSHIDYSGSPFFEMSVYLGDFNDGVADGELISLYEYYPGNSTTTYKIGLQVLNYENGIMTGIGEVQTGYIKGNEIVLKAIATGNYTDEEPEGEFEIIALPAAGCRPLANVQVGDDGILRNIGGTAETPRFNVTFHVDAGEILEYWDWTYNSEEQHYGHGLDDFVIDDTGEYYIDKWDVYSYITLGSLWYGGTRSNHREGSENILPGGMTLQEYEQLEESNQIAISNEDDSLEEKNSETVDSSSVQITEETQSTDNDSSLGEDIISLWIGEFISSDNQIVTVERVDSDNVYVSFYGYGEEGWYTSEQVWALDSQDNSTAVYRNYNNSGDLLSSDYITLYPDGECMHIESQSFRLGDYYKQ